MKPLIPPPVHLPPHKLARRDSPTKRAMPLSEDLPRVTALDVSGRVEQLQALVDALDVVRSARYRPGGGSTWCNVYSTDFALLYGAFLPHVFWTAAALAEMARTGIAPPVRYGVTVTELSANGLAAWMEQRGGDYGWQRCHLPSTAQAAADGGGLGIVLAGKPGGIGHISVIIPQSEKQRPLLDSKGVVIAPVQSQAGARNMARFSSRWWDRPGYRGGLWIHAWTEPAALLKRAAALVMP